MSETENHLPWTKSLCLTSKFFDGWNRRQHQAKAPYQMISVPTRHMTGHGQQVPGPSARRWIPGSPQQLCRGPQNWAGPCPVSPRKQRVRRQKQAMGPCHRRPPGVPALWGRRRTAASAGTGCRQDKWGLPSLAAASCGGEGTVQEIARRRRGNESGGGGGGDAVWALARGGRGGERGDGEVVVVVVEVDDGNMRRRRHGRWTLGRRPAPLRFGWGKTTDRWARSAHLLSPRTSHRPTAHGPCPLLAGPPLFLG